jgi:serine/threonine protein kinase
MTDLDEIQVAMMDRRPFHYGILGKIGDGGYSNVYLATPMNERSRFPEFFAVKRPRIEQRRTRAERSTIPDDISWLEENTPHYRFSDEIEPIDHYVEERILTIEELFLEEAQTLRTIEHPNIIQLLGCGKTEDGPELYFEFAPQVFHFERKPHFSEKDILTLVRDLARGLTYAHAYGYVNLDLKWSNSGEKEAKFLILDWGLAQNTGEDGYRTPIPRGTPRYMAPEVLAAVAGGKATLSSAADVWSLGAMIDMLEYDAFFKAYTPNSKNCIRKEKPQTPVYKFLQQLARDCLKRNPRNRITAATIAKRAQGMIDQLGYTTSHQQHQYPTMLDPALLLKQHPYSRGAEPSSSLLSLVG